MKNFLTLPLFAVALLAASQPALAASKKADARAAALVAALQAVSPDPLGGQLGLAAATASTTAKAADRTTYAAQSSGAAEQGTTLVRKSAQKS